MGVYLIMGVFGRFNKSSLSRKGRRLVDRREYDGALECFNRILNADSKDINAWLDKVNVLVKLERYGDALDCYGFKS